MSVHDFEVRTADGATKALSDYKRKTFLIVNTASFCGYTKQLMVWNAFITTIKTVVWKYLLFRAINLWHRSRMKLMLL